MRCFDVSFVTKRKLRLHANGVNKIFALLASKWNRMNVLK